MTNPESFDHYPEWEELYPHSRFPGFKYAYVLPEHVGRYQEPTFCEDCRSEHGYSLVHGARVFTLRGPKGTCDALPMAGCKHLPGLSPQQCRNSILVDPAIEAATGLPIDEVAAKEASDAKEAQQEAKPAPKPSPPQPAPSQPTQG